MANEEKGTFTQRNNLALIVSAVLLVLFVVFTVLNINLTIGYIILVIMLMVAFFGIVPYLFGEEESA